LYLSISLRSFKEIFWGYKKNMERHVETQRHELYAADVYRRLEDADPQDTHAIIARLYTSPDDGGPCGQSGIDKVALELGDPSKRVQMMFYETLLNPEVRTSFVDASEALRRAGFRVNKLTCSRGIVKVQSFRYDLETVNLNFGWTLRIDCICLGGRVSKTIRENPEVYAIGFHINNVFEAHIIGTVATLIFARPTLVDIRPIISKVRETAETYGCTEFETKIPLEWARNLWMIKNQKKSGNSGMPGQ
jgi:hypothetical protein